jgi:sugar lactone lactonase YvrE
MHIRAFAIGTWSTAGPRLDLDTDRVLITMPGGVPGHPDGMKPDELGNIWPIRVPEHTHDEAAPAHYCPGSAPLVD